MELNLTNIGVIVLGSSVVATLITKFWEHIERRRIETREGVKNLYGPLKFYLLCTNLNKINREELMKERGTILTSVEYGKDPYTREIDALIKKRWEYFEKIKEILELNPEHIKKEHFSLVRDFVDGYIKREVIGKDVNKGDRITNDERLSKMLNAVDALEREILD